VRATAAPVTGGVGGRYLKRPGRNPQSLTSTSSGTDLILRRPLREQRASKDAPTASTALLSPAETSFEAPSGRLRTRSVDVRSGVLTIKDSALLKRLLTLAIYGLNPFDRESRTVIQFG